MNFLNKVKKEAEKALKKHGPTKSLHEGYGILMEEVDEFWDEVKKRPENRDMSNLRLELVQIASTCYKIHQMLEE
jgi:NTP pyrophosphatase (non-canonical NTP hydrolase)